MSVRETFSWFSIISSDADYFYCSRLKRFRCCIVAVEELVPSNLVDSYMRIDDSIISSFSLSLSKLSDEQFGSCRKLKAQV